jgi:hypothetical protein
VKPSEWHAFALERTENTVKLVVKGAVLHTEPATSPTVYGFSAAGAVPARMRDLKLECNSR